MVLKLSMPLGGLKDPRLLLLFCRDALLRHFQIVMIRIKISIRKDVVAPILAPTTVLLLIRVDSVLTRSNDGIATICLERSPSKLA